MEEIEANRRAWDERAVIHRRDATGFYRLDALRAGRDPLTMIEAEGLGDVAGLRVVHLQCHIGTDTIGLARRGARAVGLDFSGEAIAAARVLAAECGVDAEFVQADVHDARAALDGAFDLVFVTWGALPWLPDMARWAAVVASLLAPGGALFLAEQHPSFVTLAEEDGRLTPHYDWRTAPDRPVVTQETRTYTGDPTPLRNTEHHSWDHPLSEVIGGLLGAGLRLTSFREHEALPWSHVPMMRDGGDGLYRLPEGMPRMPLSYSLRAEKPRG
ncbi:class I SAM-dependent methyltransferase [Roseomonas sp. CCTCC AB2023176]|uniref:class I SAM-dependent methyltransferase n=1 Tax=Roseomonas sp. CCTCC AB2023176 TaxID=3342640 RepID=UPI0035D883EF